MQKNILFLLASRLLFSFKQNYAMRAISIICFIAIMLSTCALTLVICIMQGFESATVQRLQSIHPPVIMQAPLGQSLNWQKIEPLLKSNPKIAAYAPCCMSYGVLHNPKLDNSVDWHAISVIKGIVPELEAQVSQIANQIENHLKINASVHDNYVLIGATLAKNLQLKTGESAEIFIPSTTNAKQKTVNFEQIPIKIGGTIKTGIADLDENLIIAEFSFLEKQIEDNGFSEVGIKLVAGTNETQAINDLKTQFKLIVFNWQTMYTPIVAALRLEKYVATSIAFLIILIASLTLIALLFMLIIKQMSMIAVLRILGVSINQIHYLFSLVGVLLSACASGCGIILSIITSLIIKNYYLIELPDIYYVTSLPISMAPKIFFTIWLITILVAWLAAQIPLTLIKRLNLVNILKTNN